jgi:hypothetical protein
MNRTQDSCIELIIGTLDDLKSSCDEPYFEHYNKTGSNKGVSIFKSCFTCLKCQGTVIMNRRPIGYHK